MAIYACSDLHGRYDLYQQIKNFLKPEDTVYFLGDACDRGPNSWKLVKAIYEDPQFIYLKGNHEDMFVRAAADIEHYGVYDINYIFSVQNGGEQNIIDWEKDPERSLWISRINSLPTFAEIENQDGLRVILTHAGFTPQWDSANQSMIVPEEKELLWDRKHFKSDKDWDNIHFANVICVHGHTPIPCLRDDREHFYTESPYTLGAYWYCGNHKVCIDNGSPYLGIACLLDLNSWDEHIFSK